jgi:hypothetical protein
MTSGTLINAEMETRSNAGRQRRARWSLLLTGRNEASDFRTLSNPALTQHKIEFVPFYVTFLVLVLLSQVPGSIWRAWKRFHPPKQLRGTHAH